MPQKIQFKHVLPSVMAGILIGFIVIFIEISFAALIFSGDLNEFLSDGIGFMLFGAFVIGIVIALTSSFPGMIACPQDGPVAILAIMAGTIAGSMHSSAAPSDILATVISSIIITSLMTGIFLWMLGKWKLGNLIRFIPYPVIGGFLAGTGWLLLSGAIGLMADIPVSISTVLSFFELNVLMKWLPGAIFGILLLMILRRYSHFCIMPAMITASIGLFYLILLFAGISLADAGSHGWLLGPFPKGGLWKPTSFFAFPKADWPLIAEQIGSIGSVMIISAISLLLNAGGVELAVRRDIELDGELRSAGLANFVAGFGGSTPGFQTLSLSVLGNKLGAYGRLTGIISAVLCGITCFFGGSLLSFFPKPVLGGLLLFLGLALIIEWVYDAFFTLSKIDYILVLLIIFAIARFGFLQGIMVGLIASVLIFVIRYSRINLVKNELSGANYQSNIRRNPVDRKLLMMKGEQLCIYKLQGYIFFGTANYLLERIKLRVLNPDLQRISFLLLDFSLVTGMDSSAMNSIEKMSQLAENEYITVIFTDLPPEIHAQFKKKGYDDNNIFKYFIDVDHGLEWWEEQILASPEDGVTESESLLDQNDLSFWDSTIEDSLKYLESREELEQILRDMENYIIRKDIPENYHLITQGEEPKGIWIIQDGEVTIQLENNDGTITRLQKLKTGTIIGEISLYTECAAEASVVTQSKCDIYFLSAENLAKMEQEIPAVAASFHRHINFILSERVKSMNATLKALM